MLRVLIAVATICLAAFITVAGFSVANESYACEGELRSDGLSSEASMYFQLSRFRWWVKLWSDGVDGTMHLELPDGYVRYYTALRKVGPEWLITLDKGEHVSGRFSTLSHRLTLATFQGDFEGTCRNMDGGPSR